MLRNVFLAFILFFSSESFCQSKEDNLIVVTVSDSADLYKRVRQAISYTNLIIRDDCKGDTLLTHAERIHGFTIFVVAKVIISGKQVHISGAYGLGMEGLWGYPDFPKSYKPILYFKGSEAWQVLRQIAIKLDARWSLPGDKA